MSVVLSPRDEWGKSLEEYRVAAVNKLLVGNETVLDYGCGQGAYVAYLNRYENVRCVGVDIFPYEQWPKVAEDLAMDLKEVFRVVKDGVIPFPNDFFDVCLSFEVLEHCPDPLKTLSEMVRVTRNYLMVSVPDCEDNLKEYGLAYHHWTDRSHVNLFTASSILELFRSAGVDILWTSRAFKVDLNACYWNHVRLPRLLKIACLTMTRWLRLCPPLFGSIVVAGRKS
jgi:SAM-dependent methyltransferase